MLSALFVEKLKFGIVSYVTVYANKLTLCKHWFVLNFFFSHHKKFN